MNNMRRNIDESDEM